MDISKILTQIPDGLKNPLIVEYNSIVQFYLEKRWTAAELSGGKFCEIVFSILDGHAKGRYATIPFKPSNFMLACRGLETNSHVPRSFQILIPRMLPALYEIRNNRNVGHVGGDVDPNSMDSQAVVSMCSWILGEIIRVFHTSNTIEAQKIVDSITSRKIPLIWQDGNIKRVLNTKVSLKDQILLLLVSETSKTSVDDLFIWSGSSNKTYFLKNLRTLHSSRVVELSSDEKNIEILPTGIQHIEITIQKLSNIK